MSIPLPQELLDLLRRPSPCFIATLMPDGSPQLTQTWVTTDGEHIVINTPDWTQKTKNVARDDRVAVNVVDPDETRCYFAVRGRVISTTTEGGAESIDEIFRNTWEPTTRISRLEPKPGRCSPSQLTRLPGPAGDRPRDWGYAPPNGYRLHSRRVARSQGRGTVALSDTSAIGGSPKSPVGGERDG